MVSNYWISLAKFIVCYILFSLCIHFIITLIRPRWTVYKWILFNLDNHFHIIREIKDRFDLTFQGYSHRQQSYSETLPTQLCSTCNNQTNDLRLKCKPTQIFKKGKNISYSKNRYYQIKKNTDSYVNYQNLIFNNTGIDLHNVLKVTMKHCNKHTYMDGL